jgi:hypothetical protein
MSGPDQAKRFGLALLDLVLDGKLPSDDTPLINVGGHAPIVPPAPTPPTNAVGICLECERCDGEGQVRRRGVMVACPGEAGHSCPFAKNEETPR